MLLEAYSSLVTSQHYVNLGRNIRAGYRVLLDLVLEGQPEINARAGVVGVSANPMQRTYVLDFTSVQRRSAKAPTSICMRVRAGQIHKLTGCVARYVSEELGRAKHTRWCARQASISFGATYFQL
jgi:hypothetical protein